MVDPHASEDLWAPLSHNSVFKSLFFVIRTAITNLAGAKDWGCSSVGRAVALQAIGQEFDPPQLHHLSSTT